MLQINPIVLALIAILLGCGGGSSAVNGPAPAVNPANSACQRVTDFPGTKPQGVAAFVLGNRAYALGGTDGQSVSSQVDAFDGTAQTWSRKGDFPGQADMTAAAFALGSKGYVGTGHAPEGGYAPTQAFSAYDPASDAWFRKRDFPGTARGFAQGFAMGDRDYLGLGITSLQPAQMPQDLWSYDPTADAWTRQTDLACSGRGMSVSFTLGDSVHLGLGNDASMNSLRDIWQYQPR